MTSNAISRPFHQSGDRLWRAISLDLAFWTTVGAVATLLSVPVGNLIGIRPLWFAVGAAGLALVSVALLLGLSQRRPVSRSLVWGFAAGNLALAPVLWLTALLGWLPLSGAGNWGLALCGDAMFLLGLYQLVALRRRVT